jgi:predicted aspartyl protease
MVQGFRGWVMKKTSFIIDFKFLTLSLVVLCILFIPILIFAGEFYQCHDKGGNETLSDFPVDGQTCTQFQTYEETTGAQREKKTIVSSDDKITKIVVRGNQVLVPVTLIYDKTEVNVHLLMDTGATGTTIHTEIADRLYINLYKSKKAKGEVVGGAIIEASIIRMDGLKVGPHTFRNQDVFIVPHEGPTAKYDGLLGMDVLGSVSYKIDLAKQVIIWE